MADLSEGELKARSDVSINVDQNAKIISVINPDLFIDSQAKAEIKSVLKKGDFWQAVNKAKAASPEEHMLVYDSSSETLEPVYFWILDKVNDMFGGSAEKLIDTFSSSMGSGYFAEMGQRGTKMQEEAMKVMQTIGILVKSLVNIIYDLREFEIRLSQYKSANSKDENERESGLLALKQIWMDNVDIKRGAGSINAMASGNLQFVTLRDSFMIANSVADVKKLDLNDRVKRILEARVAEFLKWREYSEKEMKKRYDIEKSYLKSQVNSLKMYTRWVKPYLRAASQLEMANMKNPGLVNAFNTMILQLSLFAKNELKMEDAIFADKELPYAFRNIKLKRKYFSCILVDFFFRGIPQKAGQHYVFGGRVEVKFRSFALNEEELNALKKALDDSDLNDALKLGEGMTTESLNALKDDIEYFLKNPEARESDKNEEKKTSDVNPFSALFGLGRKKEKKDEKDEKKEESLSELLKKIKPDNYIEKMVRELAQKKANDSCFSVFDIYKKAHGMASHPVFE